MNSAWFAVQLIVGHERPVATMLEHKGYQVFLPMRTQSEDASSRKRGGPKPLFSGYIFCNRGGGNAPLIVTTPGVVRILGCGGQAATIPQTEIDRIQTLVDSGVPVKPVPYLKSGAAVMVTAGPLAGTSGILLGDGAARSLVVSVDLLRRSVAVKLDRSWIEPASTMS